MHIVIFINSVWRSAVNRHIVFNTVYRNIINYFTGAHITLQLIHQRFCRKIQICEIRMFINHKVDGRIASDNCWGSVKQIHGFVFKNLHRLINYFFIERPHPLWHTAHQYCKHDNSHNYKRNHQSTEICTEHSVVFIF